MHDATNKPDAHELSISIVIYNPDILLLRQTIISLRGALQKAYDKKLLKSAYLIIVNNDSGKFDSEIITNIFNVYDYLKLDIINPGENVGYGRGHNIACKSEEAKYHIILNSDVVLEVNAITEAIKFMNGNPKTGMIAPKAFSPSGKRQYLCKRYPTVFDLLTRGFASSGFRKYFSKRLGYYEMQGVTEELVKNNIPIVSGCFMFCRTEALDSINGFSADFFLYFEDFDLSLRMSHQCWEIIYVPTVIITHYGGGAAKKGIKHIILFIFSAFKFFNMHGWKLW